MDPFINVIIPNTEKKKKGRKPKDSNKDAAGSGPAPITVKPESAAVKGKRAARTNKQRLNGMAWVTYSSISLYWAFIFPKLFQEKASAYYTIHTFCDH